MAEGLITYVKDRPGHDKRYAIDANKLKDDGLFIVGGHFGFLDKLNIQMDKGEINKRLRSKRRWVNTLKTANFRKIKI